jgi:hypothetical protein
MENAEKHDLPFGCVTTYSAKDFSLNENEFTISKITENTL